MSDDAQAVVLAALRRIVEQAFDPPTTRHRRAGFAGSACVVTCQACALEQGRLALARQREAEAPAALPDCTRHGAG